MHHCMQNYVIHLRCSALIVNLTQPRITWKGSLSEKLSTSVWPRKISLRACLHFIKAERLVPPWVAPLPSRGLLNCIRVENSSGEQASQWHVCTPLPLLLTVSAVWLAVSSLWCRGILPVLDCNLELQAKTKLRPPKLLVLRLLPQQQKRK